MTLKDKFENIDIVAYDSIHGQYYSNLNEQEIEVIIKIVDEFAIGFLKWYVQEYSENEIEYLLKEYKK